MSVRVVTASYVGIMPYLVEVEADILSGIPNLSIVGMGDTAISESKYRVKSALKNTDFSLPAKSITINLSPAGLKKEGANFDLPIALGILIATNQIQVDENFLKDYLFLGELSLDARVRGVRGLINSVILAKEKKFKGIIVPAENYYEANLIKGIDIIPVNYLQDVLDFFDGTYDFNRINKEENVEIKLEDDNDLDFNEVKGQYFAKRGMEIAAAGNHNILLIGSPGSGKSMLSKRITSIMPKMTDEEIIECTKIHSVAGELTKSKPIINSRPIRFPHHSTSLAAMVGGGKKVMPGEISLASYGVLILDEMTEFQRQVLEALRQPLEDRIVSITRADYRVEFKTDFLLVATSNPCPCGMLFEKNCKCSANEINKYMKKLSGPILDRIDLYVEVKRLSEEELVSNVKNESSKDIAKRVEKARKIQMNRCGKLNSYLSNKEIEQFCKIDENDKIFFTNSLKHLEVSARSFNKILKVARTIADLENSENIQRKHLLEALAFRKK